MTDRDEPWREGHALLCERLASVPAALRATAARGVPALDLGRTPIRRVVATGIGSSSAHAALLVHALEQAGRAAVVRSLSAFTDGALPSADDVLVVFSQGLSPNAELALRTAAAWRRTIVVTGVTDPERLQALRARRVVVHTIDGGEERGTLVRVVGPLTGYVAALQVAHALGAAALPPIEPALAAVEHARIDGIPATAFDAAVAFVTSGSYDRLVQNLQYKVMEGMLQPMPPVWDVLHLAHGPVQERLSSPTTFLALTRPDAPGESALLDRFATMLDPARHRLLRLHASLPLPLAILEHESMLNALMLRVIETRGIDQVRWPGRDADAPLYDVAAPPLERRLGKLAWTDVSDVSARTVIIPLGATEQHGPHLPFSTDTIIAGAVAARLADVLGDAIALPALPLGCSSEHMGFPGTLDVTPETLSRVLGDLLASLARHGVAEALVFSAHGGNMAALRAALPALRAGDPAMTVHAFLDLDGLTSRLHAEAARYGISATDAGHHAGEIETSIMLALEPTLVRARAMAPGHVTPVDDPQALFYPDLRLNAPSGVVGDPSRADAARGTRYVAAWVDVLAGALRSAKKRA